MKTDGTCRVPMPETRVTDLFGYLDKTAQENVIDDFIFKLFGKDINKCNKDSGTLISKRNDNCMLNSTPAKTPKSMKSNKSKKKSGHTEKQKEEENLIPKANITMVIDKILERYGSVATNSEKGKIMEAVKQIMQNLDKLKMFLFPIELSFHDEKTGSGTIQDLIFSIFQHKVEKIVRISSEKLALVDCRNVEEWLKEKLLLADKSPKYTISVPDSAEIMQKIYELTISCQMSLHQHQASKDFQNLENIEQSFRSDIQTKLLPSLVSTIVALSEGKEVDPEANASINSVEIIPLVNMIRDL